MPEKMDWLGKCWLPGCALVAAWLGRPRVGARLRVAEEGPRLVGFQSVCRGGGDRRSGGVDWVLFAWKS